MRHLAALLLLISLAVVVNACSDNPGIKARYEAEKMFFEAERMAPSGPVRDRYGEVIDFCYAALETVGEEQYRQERQEIEILAFEASGRLVQLFYADQDFDTCVSICSRLLEQTDLQGESRVSAYLNLGRSLQAAGQWDSALAVYQYSTETFYPPLKPDGEIMTGLFYLPARIFQTYMRVGDTVEATMQFDRAEFYYRDLIADFPNAPLAPASHASLAILYEQTGRWQRSIDELALVTDSLGQIAPSARERIADLYANHLQEYDQALAGYDNLIGTLTGADTVNLPDLKFKRAMIFVETKQYSEARQLFKSLREEHPRYFADSAAAQYAVARTFDSQRNWERAETEYRYLLENYKDSEEAVATYLYLAARLAEKGRRLEAQRLEEEARAVYRAIAADRPGTRAEAIAMTYQAELHRRSEDWPKAAETLSEIFRKFPYTEIGYRSAMAAAALYREKMDNPRRSDSLVTEIKKKLTVVDESQEF